MKRTGDTLPRRAPHWRYDLPLPSEAVVEVAHLGKLETAPKHSDSIYLELSRSTTRIRGIGVFGGSIVILVTTIVFLFFLCDIALGGEQFTIGFTLFVFSSMGALYWLVIPTVRMDIELPRDEPIRFNRKRQKFISTSSASIGFEHSVVTGGV